MENELQPQENKNSEIAIRKETLELVRRTIFPTATDDELQLYVHKCLTCGVHPLDGLIHPSKYNSPDGGKRVVFICSIDMFRSKAEDSKMYDGQDETIFEYIDHNDGFDHPNKAKVLLYRKGVTRPFVGTAKWSEFFPQQAIKQFMYKKMPEVMLGKCAEAQAFRKAFPQQLNKLYIEEEMGQAMDRGSTFSNKPKIEIKTDVGAETSKTSGTISEKQKKRLYAISKANNVDIDKLKMWLKDSLGIDDLADIPSGDKYNKVVNSIEKSTQKINAYKAVMDDEAFKTEAYTLAMGAGYKDEEDGSLDVESLNLAIEREIKIEGLKDFENVPADLQETVINWLKRKVEEV